MIIPRGGSGLHELCKQHSTIPVIVGGVGVCHTFVEKKWIKIKAILLLITPKPNVQAPVTLLETLLVQHSIAEEFFPNSSLTSLPKT